MRKKLLYTVKLILVLILFISSYQKVYAQDFDAILKQLVILQQDIKTLEKAVYSDTSDVSNSSVSLSSDSSSNDILTKHLLKLSELEEQFKNLTNNFEEINFKLDKLSRRITKIQTDNQVRFQDLETTTLSDTQSNTGTKKKNCLEVVNQKI